MNEQYSKKQQKETQKKPLSLSKKVSIQVLFFAISFFVFNAVYYHLNFLNGAYCGVIFYIGINLLYLRKDIKSYNKLLELNAYLQVQLVEQLKINADLSREIELLLSAIKNNNK